MVATFAGVLGLREAEVDEADRRVQRAVNYLLKSFDGDQLVWEILPPQVEDAPHAPWWTYADISVTFLGFPSQPDRRDPTPSRPYPHTNATS